jgi:hypothetical protein
VVIAVAAVETAAPGCDEPGGTEQPQVVGDQVLWLVDERHQLADSVVAPGQRGEKPPAQWVTVAGTEDAVRVSDR